MVSANTLAAVGLQFGAGAIAAYGAWRCRRLQLFAKDARLTALLWFFGLFAASVALHAVWEVQVDRPWQGDLTRPWAPGGSDPNTTRPGFPPDRDLLRPAGAENVNVWLVGHHVLMSAALAVAVMAYTRRRPEQAHAMAMAAPLVFFSDLVPLLLGLQAALTLYVAVRAWVNNKERNSPGAMQVALGFLLFFTGHLLFFISHRPGQGRQGLGDVLTLVGITLLVQALPGRK